MRRIEGTFDDCVAACAEAAAREGWQVIADTAYPGYMEIPGHIMTGYSTIFAELDDQLDAIPDVVLLPAGVGGLAGRGRRPPWCSATARRGPAWCASSRSRPPASSNPSSTAPASPWPPAATSARSWWAVLRSALAPGLAHHPRRGRRLPGHRRPACPRRHARLPPHGVVAGRVGRRLLAGCWPCMNDADLATARDSAWASAPAPRRW